MSRVYGNIARCLNALLDDKLIELTIPERPRSRLQKYRVTRKGRQVAKTHCRESRSCSHVKERRFVMLSLRPHHNARYAEVRGLRVKHQI